MAELRAYKPPLRDRIAWAIAGGAGKLGAGRYAQQDIAGKVGGLIDFIPGLGDAVGVNDAYRDYQSGNYGLAAAGLGLTAVGAIPGVGDAVSSAGRRAFPYYRRSQSPDTPDNGAGYSMFAQGDPDRIESYGENLWGLDPQGVDPSRIVDSGSDEFTGALSDFLATNQDDLHQRGLWPSGWGGEPVPIEEMIETFSPSDIVDTAQAWDSHDELVPMIREAIMGPRGWDVVTTPDGAISFDPSVAKYIAQYGIAAAVAAGLISQHVADQLQARGEL